MKNTKLMNLVYKLTGTDPKSDLKPKEVLAYSFAGFGQNLICAYITSFLIVFLTDGVKIDPMKLAYLFLFARLFDAFNDPIMGTIVDKTKTRWGKLRPYLLFSPIPIGILTVLCFIRIPGLQEDGSFVYISVMYVLWGIAYTTIDVPYWGLSSALTSDTEKRNIMLTVARLLSTLGAGIVQVLIPILQDVSKRKAESIAMQGQSAQTIINFKQYISNPDAYYALMHTSTGEELPILKAYSDELSRRLPILFIICAIILVVLAIPSFWVGFKYTKERFNDNIDNKKLSDNLALLFKNKPLLLIVLSGILGAGRYIFTASGFYYAKYTLQSPAIFSLITMMVVPGGLIASVLTPVLSKKYGKKNLFIYSHIVGAIFLFLAYFAGIKSAGKSPAAIGLGALALIISGIPMGFSNILSYAMISDTVEYLEWKTGKRAEGICFAMQTFISKVGMAVTAFVSLIVISKKYGYVPNQIQQPQNILNLIWSGSMLIPAISALLCVIPFFFYNLTEDRQKQMVKEIQERKNNSRMNVQDAVIVEK